MKVIKYPTGGVLGEAERFILDNQLLRRDLWRDFVSMFRLGLDSDNNGWRGEYFGKMMRGGCFTYALTRDRELYGVLTEAIEDILTTQRPDGVISSYRAGEDYRGWDMWARKYVLLAMFYYMEICADDGLKKRVLDSAKRQLKAIMRVVGPAEDGKTPITRTSVCWRGLNSSSILEPVMLYYKLTGDPELLKFA
ncbi:MAG: glycoside hydrolase family 127 protein [Clostridia bacterium]|nr:glycoside hydrolase family 127 protein [Clostridia bacterium]